VLALIAAVIFLFVAFGNSEALGGIDLFYLGLAFLAAHFAWDIYPWNRRRR
jgi:hypothetical protein